MPEQRQRYQRRNTGKQTTTKRRPATKSRAKRSNKKDSVFKKMLKKIKAWWKSRTKKQKLIISGIALLVLVILIVGIFIWHKLSLIGSANDTEVKEVTDEIDGDLIDGMDSSGTLNQVIKKWATNEGKLMSDENVKNILLVGLDTVSGCTDTLMLASIDTENDKMTLVSFYRDTYVYVQPTNKKNKATFSKLNAAYGKGGIETLINTIQNHYKIKIDDYALVNYDTFPKVIDALGGVNVNVTSKEATFLNETWYEWSLTGNEQPWDYVAGNNHLNGEMALTFCRIRKLDSDINRTERQRRVIVATLDSFKSASVSKMNKAVNSVLPYISTGMSNTEIITLAGQAIREGWLKYELLQTTMPSDDTGKAGYAGDQWIWIADFPGAAYELQNMLYGKSNIKLSDDRINTLTLFANATETPNGTTAATTKKTTTTTTEHTHKYKFKERVAATCTEEGYSLCECSCGATDKREITAALGHKWDEANGKVIKEATCTEAGQMEVSCTRSGCTETKIVEIPMLSHNFDSNGVCTLCGHKKTTID